MKIHCSAECKVLLDRLGGYKLAKRGIIGMKGKGEVLTYWLLGEDACYRTRRSEERAKRREQMRKDVNRKSNIYRNESIVKPNSTMAPRSSLKNKNSLSCPRNMVSRCVSLESPKKLRFANGSILDCNPYHKCSHDPIADVVFNEMPVKRRPSKVTEQVDEFAESAMSVSCPCIENITSTLLNRENDKALAKRFDENEYDNAYFNSEPLLLTSSIPCITVSSEKDLPNISVNDISDISVPLLRNYTSPI